MDFINDVVFNLTLLGCAMGILSIVWSGNVILSMFFNIKVMGDIFDFKKLIHGVIKLIALCLGTALLTIGITLFPIFIAYAGIPIPEEYINMFNIGAIIILFGDATIKYTMQAYDTLKQILNK